MKKGIDASLLPVGKMVLYRKNDPVFRGVHLRKAKDGSLTWYLYSTHTGKGQWIKVGSNYDGVGPEQCIAKRRQLQEAKVMGTEMPSTVKVEPPKAITLNEAWDRWLSWRRSEGLSIRYLDGEASRWNRYVRNTIGDQLLTDLSAKSSLINNVQGEMRQRGLSTNTIKQVMMNIKKAYKQAVAEEVYGGPIPFRHRTDPTNMGVLIKSSKARRERWFTMEQATELMAYLKDRAEDPYNQFQKNALTCYRQCAFALYTGLRQGEVLKLTPNSIDLNNMQIIIGGVKHATMSNKTRYVDIPGVLLPIIEGILAEKKWRRDERLFPVFARKVFENAIIHFGYNRGVSGRDIVNRISFHSLRHTFGALLVEQGVHLVTIKEMMGHDTIEAVQIYAKAGPNVRKKAMERYNEIW